MLRKPFLLLTAVLGLSLATPAVADLSAVADPFGEPFAIIALVDDGGGGGWVPPGGGGTPAPGDGGGDGSVPGGGDSGPSQREVLTTRFTLSRAEYQALTTELNRLRSQGITTGLPADHPVRLGLQAAIGNPNYAELGLVQGYLKQSQNGPVYVEESNIKSARFRENTISFEAGTAAKLDAIQKATANAMSPTVGDPVRLGDGSFVHQEEGIRLPFFGFAIDTVRYYSSAHATTGRFGRGWTSLLDWRLIRGYTPVDAATADELAAARALLPLIAELTAEIDLLYPEMYAETTITALLANLAMELRAIATALHQVAAELDLIALDARNYGYPDLALEVEGDAAAARAEAAEAEAIARCFEMIVAWTPEVRLQQDQLMVAATELEALIDAIAAMISAGAAVQEANAAATFTHQDHTLSHTGFDTVTVLDPWGRGSTFALAATRPDGTRQFAAATKGMGTLYEWVDGTFSLRATDLSEVRFGTDGLLREVVDSYSNGYRIIYQGGLPRAIVDSAGREIQIETEARGTIIALRYAETEYRYEYDDGGHLIAQYPPGGAPTQYRYADNRLISITRGTPGAPEVLETQITYQPVEGQQRATLVRLPNGGVEAVSYQGTTVTFTDADGVITRYEMSNGLVLSRCDAHGACTHYEYDAEGRETWRQGPDGAVERRHYDTQGRLIRHDLPGGDWQATAYNQFDKPVHEWDNRGAETRYQYNDHGRLVEVRDALGNRERLVLDDRGSHHLILTAEGGQLIIHRNSYGLPVEIIDAEGVVEQLDYDSWGRTTRHVVAAIEQYAHHYDPAGNLRRIVTPAGTTELVYDDLGRLVQRIEPGGATTAQLYLADGLVQTTRYPDGAQQTRTLTPGGRLALLELPNGAHYRFTYDDRGRLTARQEQVSGARWSYRHDAIGNLVESREPSGAVTLVEYDGRSRAIAVHTPTGGRYLVQWEGDHPKAIQTPDGMTLEYRRDALGRPTEVTVEGLVVRRVHYEVSSITTTDAAGHNITVVHDAAHRPLLIIYPDGSRATMTYDPWGRQLSLLGADGGRTTWEYDASGRVIATRYPDGRHFDQQYDVLAHGGTERTTRWSDGHIVTEQTDALGRVIRVLDNRYGTHRRHFPDRSTMVVEDAAFGRIEYRTDTLERPVLITHNGVAVARFAYPDFRTVVRTDALGRSWQTQFDAAARTHRIVEPDGATVTYLLNAAARVIAAVSPAGNRTAFSYDSRGNLTGIEDATGRRQTFDYTTAMQLAQITDELGGRRFSYGANGLLRSITAAEELMRFEYDAQRRLTAEHRAGLTMHHRYDEAGKTIAMGIDPHGVQVELLYDAGRAGPRQMRVADRVVNLTYDDTGRPQSLSIDGVEQLSLSYDNAGRATRVVVADQLTQRYWYDEAGRPAAHAAYDARSASLLAARVYLYNPDGSLNAGAATSGRLELYDYDANARLETVTISYSPDFAPALSALMGEWLGDQYLSGSVLRETVPIDPARRAQLEAVAQQYLEPAASSLLANALAATHGIPIRFEYDREGNRRAIRTPLFDLPITVDAAGAPKQVGEHPLQTLGGTVTIANPTSVTNVVVRRDSLFGYPHSVTTAESRQEWVRDHRGVAWMERIVAPEGPAAERATITFSLPHSPIALTMRADQPLESNPTRIERAAAPVSGTDARARPGGTAGTGRLGPTTVASGALTLFLGDQPILVHHREAPTADLMIARDQFGQTILVRDGGGNEWSQALGRLPGGFDPQPLLSARGAAPTVSSTVHHTPTRFLLPVAGAFLSTDPALAGTNWYSYAGGDPLNYHDPSGLIIAAVSTDLRQNQGAHASAWLGSSGLETIGQSGCVLVAYTRLIQSIDPAGGWTIERTNKVAIKHDLFTPDPSNGAKNNLGPQAIAELVRVTTGHVIEIERHATQLEEVIRAAHGAEQTVWAIGRIETHPIDQPATRYGHTLNVVVRPDGAIGLADTSTRGRETLGAHERLRHVDLVRVVQAPPGATPHCQR